MADPALVDGGIASGIALLVVQAVRIARDERQRWHQKRNGGTPDDQMLREMQATRRETKAMRKTLRVMLRGHSGKLDSIAASSQEQCRLLEDGELVHQKLSDGLAKAVQGIMLLIDRSDRRGER